MLLDFDLTKLCFGETCTKSVSFGAGFSILTSKMLNRRVN